MNHYEEHMEFTYSTDTEWDRADAWERGSRNPEAAWVCTDRDVWHANPFYTGPEVPHPEDEYANEEFYVVGAHAVNLYLANEEAKVYAIEEVGADMVHLYNESLLPF